MTKKQFALLLSILLAATGCREVGLHHNLEEAEADEILVVLNQHGIQATKEKEISGQDVSWKLMVSGDHVAQARQILLSNNLPNKRELGLSGVYKDKGLIPTPDEQKARYLLALKGEIINSLQKIPGVVDADIVLNVPQENNFAELDPVKKKPTASVVIRTHNEDLIAQTMTEAKVQRFVANTVPNLDPNDVTVIVSRGEPSLAARGLSEASTSPMGTTGLKEEASDLIPLPMAAPGLVEFAGLQVGESSVGRFKAYMVGLLLLLMGVSTGLLYNVVRLNRLKLKIQKPTQASQGALAGGPNSGLLQGGLEPGGIEGAFNVGNPGVRQQR